MHAKTPCLRFRPRESYNSAACTLTGEDFSRTRLAQLECITDSHEQQSFSLMLESLTYFLARLLSLIQLDSRVAHHHNEVDLTLIKGTASVITAFHCDLSVAMFLVWISPC